MCVEFDNYILKWSNFLNDSAIQNGIIFFFK